MLGHAIESRSFSWIGCHIEAFSTKANPPKSRFNPARSEREFQGHKAVASRLRVDVDFRNFLSPHLVEIGPPLALYWASKKLRK